MNVHDWQTSVLRKSTLIIQNHYWYAETIAETMLINHRLFGWSRSRAAWPMPTDNGTSMRSFGYHGTVGWNADTGKFTVGDRGGATMGLRQQPELHPE